MWSNLADSVAGIVTASVSGDWGALASSIVQTVGASLDILGGIDWSFLGSDDAASSPATVVETVTSVAETTAAAA